MEAIGTTLWAFVFVLGIIIFVHEFGHLLVAKAFGMRVFIFSFGFGPRLLGFKWGDTDCRVSLIPLGGYVKLEGEPEDHLSEDTSGRGDGKDFTSRPRWQRFLVYLAGPVMNALLTLGVLTVFYMVGFSVDASRYDRPIVGAVDPGSPAAVAGLRPGDEIVSIEGERPKNWEEAQYQILLRPDRTVRLRIGRGGEEMDVEVRSASTGADRPDTLGAHPLVRIGEVVAGGAAAEAGLKPDDAILRIGDTPIRTFNDIAPLVRPSVGKPLTLEVWRDGQTLSVTVTPRETPDGPRIGVGPKVVVKKFGFPKALREAMRWTWDMTRQTGEIIWRLVTAQLSPRNLMGPLGIARASGDAAREGWRPLFFLVAVISLQVGILNLFPLAPLDGGHMAILLAEGLVRRDFSLTVKAWILNAGAMVIFLLIGLVLYSDFTKTALFKRFLQ